MTQPKAFHPKLCQALILLQQDCDLTRKHILDMSGRSHESAYADSQDQQQQCWS